MFFAPETTSKTLVPFVGQLASHFSPDGEAMGFLHELPVHQCLHATSHGVVAGVLCPSALWGVYTSRESLTHKLSKKNRKLSCSKHLVSQVSQRPESKNERKSRQKTRTLFAAHLSLSNVRNPYTKHSGKASEKLYKHSQKVTWRPQTCCCSAKRFQNNSFCSRRFTKVLQTVGNDQNLFQTSLGVHDTVANNL